MNTEPTEQQRVFIDHYRILQIATDADLEDIRKAFRRRALVLHPDTGGDALHFLELYSAYRILSDEDSRKKYDLQFQRHLEGLHGNSVTGGIHRGGVRIPASRLKYPANIAQLARAGALRKGLRSRDRKYHLKINYDVELPLSSEEIAGPAHISIPVVVRYVCPQCRASDPHCRICYGAGTCKTGRLIHLLLEGGLIHGQILEVSLHGIRPEPFTHYKKNRIRIKISCSDS